MPSPAGSIFHSSFPPLFSWGRLVFVSHSNSGVLAILRVDEHADLKISKINHTILILLMQEVRMEQSNRREIGKCFGTAVLGPRGQLVIPVEARRELGIDAGSKLLVFGHFMRQGLIFIKVEAAEELLNIMSSGLDELAKLVKESKTADIGTEGEGNRSQ